MERSTLLLRLLGRGGPLADTVAEVRSLPKDDPMRRPMAEVLAQRRFRAPNPMDAEAQAEAEMLNQEWQAFKDQVRQEGREEGREDGQRQLIRRQLQKRFGPLDDASSARLDAADHATLEQYADRLLTADSLDEVFAS